MSLKVPFSMLEHELLSILAPIIDKLRLNIMYAPNDFTDFMDEHNKRKLCH